MSTIVYLLGKQFDTLEEAMAYEKVFLQEKVTKESAEQAVLCVLKDIQLNIEAGRLTISNGQLHESLRVAFFNLFSLSGD